MVRFAFVLVLVPTLSACGGDSDADATSEPAASSSGPVDTTLDFTTTAAAPSPASDDGSVDDTSSGGDSNPTPCTELPPGPPGDDSYPFELGGQQAWSHDGGSPAGWFHTFDDLDVGGANTTPHAVHVLLPRSYDACADGYPVVYMNDGDSSFWPGGSANKTWDVPGGLAGLYADEMLEPVIVVAIEPNDRNYEYSHTPWTGGLGADECCGVLEYADWLADDVRTFVDAHYSTRPNPEDTVIVGSSRGGLAACVVANLRPDAFGRAACMSPSFWLGLDPVFGGDFTGGPLLGSELLELLDDTLADSAVRPRLWIDWGLVRTGGFHNEVIEEAATQRGIEMVELLQTHYGYGVGRELHWVEDPMGEHDEDTWGRRFPDMLVALLGSR